ncbi:MAG: type II toxin-antitoxin system HicB family antitoxin [Candidatus Latescibacteria bacterium]|nr:type II toxin-antitoxin system HicB family antitoxin [Candidatus Latescibacterota bacterium]
MQAFNVEIWRGEKFYIAQCLEHSNCFTQGETVEETIGNIKEVIELILDVEQPKLTVHFRDELVEAL